LSALGESGARGLAPLVQVLRQRIVQVFCPCHPQPAQIDLLLEDRLRLRGMEGRNVIPMLVSDHQQIEDAAGRPRDVLHDGLDARRVVRLGRLEVDAAVDQQIEHVARIVLRRGLGKGQKKAIAEPRAIHAHLDALFRRRHAG